MTPSPELAYITGMAIGDGNISNPNGRAYRLRITCDIAYPGIMARIVSYLKVLFPKNKIGITVRPRNCIDISIYNKQINTLFGWDMHSGKKIDQIIKIPDWIYRDRVFTIRFIKGLFESDGSVYFDRTYKMANLVSYNAEIIDFAFLEISKLGFMPRRYKILQKNHIKHTLRVSKDVDKFLNLFNIQKI